MSEVEKKYVKVTEAARMGYGSENMIYNLIKSGKIPAYQLAPNMTRIKVSDLEALMVCVNADKAVVENAE